MPRLLLASLITIAACSGDTTPLDERGPTTTGPPTSITATTVPPPTATSTTTTSTSTTTTTTIPLDPDEATQLQLLAVYDAALQFHAVHGRYPGSEELIDAGFSLSASVGDPEPWVATTEADGFLVVGSSASGRGFCIVVDGNEARFGMGIIPRGVDTFRECRAVGSSNGWS